MISRAFPVTGLICSPRQISVRYYMKLLHLKRGYELFEIIFDFKWKQPATKKSSETVISFEKFDDKILLLHKLLFHLNFDMFTAAMFFFSTRFLNMCNPRTTFHLVRWPGPPDLRLYENGLACLLGWLGMVKAGWFSSMWL